MRKFVILVCLLATMSTPALARDTVVNTALADVIAMPEAKEKLDGSVKFFLKGAKDAPTNATVIGSGASNKKTNSLNKTDEYACKWVILSALITFQESAKKQGANAIINMVSNYKHNETVNPETIECHAGGLITGAAIKGDYAKIAN